MERHRARIASLVIVRLGRNGRRIEAAVASLLFDEASTGDREIGNLHALTPERACIVSIAATSVFTGEPTLRHDGGAICTCIALPGAKCRVDYSIAATDYKQALGKPPCGRCQQKLRPRPQVARQGKSVWHRIVVLALLRRSRCRGMLHARRLRLVRSLIGARLAGCAEVPRLRGGNHSSSRHIYFPATGLGDVALFFTSN